MEGEEGRREGGSERGRREGGREGRRDGEREGGKEGRRMGTRAKPGNQLVSYLYPLVKPHWTMPRQAVISTQQHKLSN